MKKVAKLVLFDNEGKSLMLVRSDHPRFGDDPDLPGGTLEDGESTLETMIREVYEETGIRIHKADVTELYAGADYSKRGTYYALYTATLPNHPAVALSWEHAAYEWLPREAFLGAAQNAKDTYMHMVYDILAHHTSV